MTVRDDNRLSWWREPLLQFVALGALFAGLWWIYGPARVGNTIVITGAQQAQARAEVQLRLGRPPTASEMAAEISTQVEDEMLAREARRLGLDQGDMIVRRRLIQKMEFLSQWDRVSATPDAAQLQDYFAAHATAYTQPARYSFVHAYWSHDRRGAQAEALADRHRATAHSVQDRAGDPFVHGAVLDNRTAQQIEALLGPTFAQALTRAEPGRWSDPIESDYGWHSVWLTAYSGARSPSLDEARDTVLADWLRDQRHMARAAALAHLRDYYSVEYEP